MRHTFLGVYRAAFGLLLWLGLNVPAWGQAIKVTFLLNTATNPDTLSENGFVQVRGALNGRTGPVLPGGKTITWDAASELIMTNIGGDYWKITFDMNREDTLRYKFWTGFSRSRGTIFDDGGWESDLNPTNGFSGIDRAFISNRKDTTVALQFYNGTSQTQDQFWRPFASKPDSVAIYFRVNMGGVTEAGRFNPKLNGPVGVRGNDVTSGKILDWGATKVILSRDSLSVDSGSFWAGAAYIPKNAVQAGLAQEYKFFINNDTEDGWESRIDNRTFKYPFGLRDTTLRWVYFDNLKPIGKPRVQSTITFRVNMKAMEDVGLFDRGKGDQVVLIGPKGFVRPLNDILMNFVAATQEWTVAEPFNLISTTPVEYKYFILWDPTRAQAGHPNFIPNLNLNDGWEEPGLTGGANRVLIYQDSPQQTPAGEFGRTQQFFSSLLPEAVIKTPITLTWNIDMRPAASPITNPANTLFRPGSDSVFVYIDDPPWALTQGRGVRELGRYELKDADRDGIYSGSFALKTPTYYQIGFFVAYTTPGGVVVNGGNSFSKGRRYYQFIRPAQVTSSGPIWPSTFNLPTLAWKESDLPIEDPPNLLPTTANRPPVVANAISNQLLTKGAASFTRNLNAAPAVFSDPDGDALIYSASASIPSIATASMAGSLLTVEPVDVGNTTITISANDGRGGMVLTSFIVTVNRRPVVANAIANQSLTVGGATFTRDLNASPAIFNDPDGDALIYTVTSSANNIATAGISGATLTVIPVAGGNATITITANDSRGGIAVTTFMVTVTGNRPPAVANVIANQTLTVGGASFTRDLNAAPAVFSDPDSDALTYTASSSATNIATANISGSMLTVAPVATGSATITVTANDGRGGTVSTNFTVTVTTANRPPVVTNTIPNQTLTVGGASFVRDLNAALAVFSDPDGDALIYTVNSSAASVATASVSISTLTVAPVAAGSATITVTANDGKGGMVSTTFGVTVVNPSSDQSAPQISHATIPLATFGQGLTIAAIITDNVAIQSARLFYRAGGASVYDSTAMSKAGGDNYQAAIPSSFITARGVEYYIFAQDGAGNRATVPTANPQSRPLVIQVTLNNLMFATLTPAKAYRMISIPFDLDDESPLNVLGDDFDGVYDDTQWRLLRYVNGVNVEFGRSGFANFAPGLGFWLITRDVKSLDAGAGRSVTTIQNYIITLPAGWSQIGNPFAFTVNWSEVIKSGNVENRLVGYQGALNEATGYDYTRTQLVPFEGYFVNNRGSTPTTIEIPPKAATGIASAKPAADWKSALQANEWLVQITAACDRYLDKDNYVGGLNDAADQWDDNDFSEAPFFDQHVSLYFPHPEWEKFPGLYTGDFRAVKTTGDYWDFRVQTNISRSEAASSEVVLRLADIKNLPADWKIVLLNKTNQWSIDFRAQGEYKFLSGETVYDFRLVVGPQNFVESNDLGLTGAPDEFVLEQNFPNPFSALGTFSNSETAIRFGLLQTSVVTIKIFDLAGHEVATLLDRVEFPAGRHQRVWDGRDSQGRVVVSGIYFCRLSAGSFVKTVKLTIMR